MWDNDPPSIQGGPLPVINEAITLLSIGLQPQLHMYKAIYRGYNPTYNW